MDRGKRGRGHILRLPGPGGGGPVGACVRIRRSRHALMIEFLRWEKSILPWVVGIEGIHAMRQLLLPCPAGVVAQQPK